MGRKTKSPQLIADRYARAIFDLSKENDNLQVVFIDLEALQQVFKKHSQIEDIFIKKNTSTDIQKDVLTQLSKKVKIHPMTNRFLKLLIQENRFNLFDQILTGFEKLYNQENGIYRAHVTVANKMKKKQEDMLKKHLKDSLNAREIELETTIDPDILGGIRVMLGSVLIDGTIKNKLEAIAQKMKGIA